MTRFFADDGGWPDARPTWLRRVLLALMLGSYEGLAGVAIAWPIAATVRTAFGNSLDGDRPLWEPGGLALLDLLLHARTSASPLLVATLLGLAVSSMVGVLPVATVLGALVDIERRRWRPLLANTMRTRLAWPRLLAWWGVQLLFFAALLFVGRELVAFLGSAHDGLSDRRDDLVTCGLAALVAFVVVPWSVFYAVGQLRLAGVDGPLRSRGWASIVRVAQGSVVRLGASWLARFVVGALFVAVGAMASDRFGGHTGAPLVTLLVVHQLVVFARAYLRVGFLADVVRATEADAALDAKLSGDSDDFDAHHDASAEPDVV